jgi:protein-L-isoaspartate O-methyltransferase
VEAVRSDNALADLKPTDAILEVGSGLGPATKSFAMQGLRILTTDLGTQVIRAARKRLMNLGNVECVESAFEARPAMPADFRLLIAAQSWQWVSQTQV